MKRGLTLYAGDGADHGSLSRGVGGGDKRYLSPGQVCYPTSITRSEDGTELKKIYDLGPEDDPAGIPRSDFEQEGSTIP